MLLRTVFICAFCVLVYQIKNCHKVIWHRFSFFSKIAIAVTGVSDNLRRAVAFNLHNLHTPSLIAFVKLLPTLLCVTMPKYFILVTFSSVSPLR